MEERSCNPVAYEGNAPYIFISYAHKDTDRVLPIIRALLEEGFRVWYDAGIEAGTEWPDYIAAHLEKSALMIAFLSKSSVASFNCRQEINYAIDLEIPMLAVYLEELTLSGGMRMRLGLSQAMFYHRHTSLSSFLTELSRSELLAPCRADGMDTEEKKPPSPKQAPVPNAQTTDDFLIQNGMLLEYRGKEKDVVIPEGVTAIGHAAFIQADIRSVIIPNTVVEIGQAAFQSCTSLESVTVPGSVKAVGHAVFLGCNSLSSVTLADGLTTVGNNMFALCSALKTVTVPASVKTIEPFAFYGCTALKEVTLSLGLTVIASDSFSDCPSLEVIAIPKSVREIGTRAFENCQNLKKAYLDKKTKYVRLFGRSFPSNTWVIKN